MSAPPVLTIDLVSDLVSPWCYLAQRRLSRALAAIDGACVPRIRWQPFEINPAMASSGMAVDAYLETVFGSAEAGREILADTKIPVFIKLAIFAVALGGIILLVSVCREKFFTWRRDPYKEIER